ncbi:MAG TPA: tetratricopeptide repeat protein [Candidatus Polarisedimenticolia bacterium]|nr:tetratricopeptide repeat protein [Candidatus Polarisedimenticolia bacterium]
MNRRIWIVLGAAALLRAVYLLDYRAHSVFWDSMLLDAEVYDAWARRIVEGDWLGGTQVFTLPPLYPYVVALIYKLFGTSYAAVYVIQSVLGLVNIHFIHAIGRKVFGETVALIAAVLAMLYGSFMFMDAKLMSTTLALTLGLGLMRLLLLAGERQTLTLWGACGALAGLTALARPETLLFVPLAAFWIWRVTSRPENRRAAAPVDQYALAGRHPWFAIAVFAAFVIVAVAPATMRNWVVSEDWSLSNLISSQAGITFYQSNNPRARGLYVFLDDEGFSGNPRTQAEEEEKIAEREAGRDLKRSEVTRHWMNKGLAWIASDPGRYVVLEARKLVRFLGSYEYSTEYIFYVEREAVISLWLASLPFAAITALALAGMLMQAKTGFKAPALLLILFVISNFLVAMIFYVSSRYRMPSAPYLILFAASGLHRLHQGFRSPISGQRTEAWIYSIIAALLFLVFHPQVDASHRIQEANVHYNAGNAWYNKQRYDDAVAEYDRALNGNPTNWRAWFNRGNALAELGRRDDAIASYRKVLEHNSRMDAARRRIRSLGGTP